MKINPNGFREYDARWLYEKDIDLEGITDLGKGLGSQIIRHTKKTNPRVIVGHDYRSYSEEIKKALINGLISATKVLKKDGILAVVTFHSIEDKIVKYFFKSLSENKSVSRYVPKTIQPDTLFKLIEKKPKTASDEELKKNLPSRTAKLRYVIKKNNFYDFETDIFKKFEHLIKVEDLSNNL